MAWILSLTTCIMLWFMGSKNKWGPIIGILNQILWYIYAIHLKEWGLLVGITAFTVIHIRNAWKWWNVAQKGN